MVTRGLITLLLLGAVALEGCAAAPTSSEPPPRPAQPTFLGVLTIHGRAFVVDLFDTPSSDLGIPGASTFVGLCLQGDDRLISFVVTVPAGAVPPRPNVSSSAIEIGGHSFVTTDVPGEYIVDGASTTLPDRGLCVLQDGVFHGVENINGW